MRGTKIGLRREEKLNMVLVTYFFTWEVFQGVY